jgi:hypothetical protein
MTRVSFLSFDSTPGVAKEDRHTDDATQILNTGNLIVQPG